MHVSENSVVAVSALVLCDPLVAFVPLQPPLAVQAVAFVLDQVRVAVPPLMTELGLADNVTDGGGLETTLTVVEAVVVPPLPVQLSANVLVADNGPALTDPLVERLPLHAPDAVHVDAPTLFHVRVDAFPTLTLVGDALSVTCGSCGDGVEPTGRTSIALTHASPATFVKTRLRVESVVTMKVRSATVLTGTTWFARSTWPSASTRKLRVVPHCVHDSRKRRLTSTCPGVTGIAYENPVADQRSVL